MSYPMRMLVTGGAGFIGSHLVERLLDQGHQVFVVDDLSTGSITNLAAVRSNPNLEVHIDSVLDKQVLAELVDRSDLIFHLAAAVGVRRIIDSPLATMKTNVHGTEMILELSVKKGKRLLITSTSEVYGKSEKVPYSEADDLVLGPTTHSRWSYACSKAIDEFLALAYHRVSALPVSIVRLFNTTGPRQTGRYGMVIPTFVRQALRGEPVTIFGTGEQTRCFSHVSDIVEGILMCAFKEEAAGQIFNLGSTEEVTINALAERVLEITGSRSEIRRLPYSEAYGEGFEDMFRRVPDIGKAVDWFGYRPTKSLDDILRSVHDDQRRDNRLPAPGIALARTATGAATAAI